MRRAYDRDWNDLIAAWLGEPPDAARVRDMRHALLGGAELVAGMVRSGPRQRRGPMSPR
ncbi:hypothetical protein ACFOHS_21840 [Jhaorihella thermophila]